MYRSTYLLQGKHLQVLSSFSLVVRNLCRVRVILLSARGPKVIGTPEAKCKGYTQCVVIRKDDGLSVWAKASMYRLAWRGAKLHWPSRP